MTREQISDQWAGGRTCPPAPAATVIVLREAAAGFQVFMVRRHTGTAFMPGADVFPGGRVDDGDREARTTVV